MVEKTTKDGVVQLYLNGELKLEQEKAEYITIGTRVEYDPETWEETQLPPEYDKALAGSGSTLSGVTVSWDGEAVVDEGGIFSGIQLNGGTFSASGVCRDAAGWYGAGLCMTATTADGGYFTPGVTPPEAVRGAIFLSGATFSGCAVNPLNGYTGHGGAVETYGGTLSVTNAMFSGNSANGSGAAGGAMALMYSNNTITGGTFSGNTAYFGGAIQQNGGTMTVNGTLFSGNTASGEATETYPTGNAGGALELHQGATASISGCMFSGNTAAQGGAVYNDTFNGAVSVAEVSGSTFSGNTAAQGGALWNGGSMRLENIVLATETDTVYNCGTLAFAGVNALGAGVVNDGEVTFVLASGTDALLSDLGVFSGDGSFLVVLSADTAVAGAKLAASAGAFSGSLSVKLDGTASGDAFTLKDGVAGNDLAIAGNAVLRLAETDGVLSVRQEELAKLVPAVSKDGSVMTWTDGEYAGEYLVEIAQNDTFAGAVRIVTNGSAFDVASAAGTYSCRAAESDGAFSAGAASWSSSGSDPRQIVSNANGRADIFFASVGENDVWSALYQAKNTVTGETASITGRNRIRDTFTGSESDANILYLSDTDNGDALFMDDIYSEFGEAARIGLIREIRAGAGADVVDMTSERYTAKLAGMTVRGGAGDDVLWGAAGGNRLFGDAGNDRITGGAGDDVIAGGAGNDKLAGGGGNDTFTFGGNWGADVVSQTADGTVTLWFASGSLSNWDEASLTYTDGENSVQVSGVTADKITLKFGEGEGYDALAAAGAFLESTAEAVYETEAMRTQGVLASL